MQDKRTRLEQLLQDRMYMEIGAFRKKLHVRGSLLLLGQKGQKLFFGKNYYIEAAQALMAAKKDKPAESYGQLWERMTRQVPSLDDDEVRFQRFDEGQRAQWTEKVCPQALKELNRAAQAAQGPDPIRVANAVLGLGWNLVASSAPEAMLTRLDRSPFGVKDTVLTPAMSMPLKFRTESLSLLQLYDPCAEDMNVCLYEDHYQTDEDYSEKAKEYLIRAAQHILQYNGYLVIDGWDPETDWLTMEDMVDVLKEVVKQNKQADILIFGLSEDEQRELERGDRKLRSAGLIFVDEDIHITDLLEAGETEEQTASQPEEADDDNDWDVWDGGELITMHLEPVGKNARSKGGGLDLDIPQSAWDQLSFHLNACLVPAVDTVQEPVCSGLDRHHELAAFLSQIRGLPDWGRVKGFSFDRDCYLGPDGVLQRVRSNLAQGKDRNIKGLKGKDIGMRENRNPLLILKGPACSGKTVLLARLAMDIARNYPTIFLTEKAVPPSGTSQFGSFVTELKEFIKTRLSGRMQKFNRSRVFLVWDGNFYENEARSRYWELVHELKLELTLIGSAYSSPMGGQQGCDENEIILDGSLSNQETEQLKTILSRGLGLRQEELNQLFRIADQKSSSLLTVLNTVFRDTDEAILFSLRQSVYDEADVARRALMFAMDNLEQARKQGAVLSTLENCVKNNDLPQQNREALLDSARVCASLLDDILAVASSGRTTQELDYTLVFDMVQTMYQDKENKSLQRLGPWQDLLDTILYFSPLICAETCGSQENWTLRYRSPLEARIFLETKYRPYSKYDTAQVPKIIEWSDVRYVTEREPDSCPIANSANECYLEYRQMEVLSYALRCGLAEQESTQSHQVLPLADALGPNADKDMYQDNHRPWYPYIAHALLEYGSDNVAACQKAAFWLRRSDVRPADGDSGDFGVLSDEVFRKMEQANHIVTAAVKLAESRSSENQRIMLYTEQIAYFRALYCPQADLGDSRYAQRTQYGTELMRQTEQLIAEKILPLTESVGESSSNRFVVGIYVDMLKRVMNVYDAQQKKASLTDRQMEQLAGRVDFFWQNIFFRLMLDDSFLQEENGRNNASGKVSECLSIWARLAKGTRWEDMARQRQQEQDADLLATRPGLWWIGRIVRIMHEDTDRQLQDCGGAREDVALILKNNLFRRSLEFHPLGEKLTEGERAQARQIVAVMEGTQALTGGGSGGCMALLDSDMRVPADDRCRLIEFYVRCKWMAETGCFIYTEGSHPALTEEQWDELARLCSIYCSAQNGGYADYFLYYLPAIRNWLKGEETSARCRAFECCRSRRDFHRDTRLRMPIGGHYQIDQESFVYLCWEDGTPVRVRCNLREQTMPHTNEVRTVAVITEVEANRSVDARRFSGMSELLLQKELYVASSLASGSGVYTIRFNADGPLVGPDHGQEGGQR